VPTLLYAFYVVFWFIALSLLCTAGIPRPYQLQSIICGEVKKAIKLSTEAKYMGAALEKKGPIAGTKGQNGFFVTSVDGEAANNSEKQWWGYPNVYWSAYCSFCQYLHSLIVKQN